MAPNVTRDSVRLRKPAVEKLRRDRINSCIDQLKVLLEDQFHLQDANAKLEKADVLEMTVAFLKQRLRPQSSTSHTAHSHGYSLCRKETLHFLSATAGSLKEVTLPPHLRCLHADATPTPSCPRHTQIAGKEPHRDLWRPW